ncbi:MAG: PAS domain-containing protein [Rhodoferax sp.]|nr:PAS domain-containing protein [Rhodoferax sp.]
MDCIDDLGLTASHDALAALRADNAMLRAEIRVARDAAEITAQLVVEQFEKTEAILTRFQIAEERLKFALEGANDGVWDWNYQSGKVFFSKRWKEMFGYAEADIGSSTEEWFSRVHPDDIALVGSAIENHLNHNTPPPAMEYRIRCKDGSWKWTLGRGMVVSRNSAGEPLRLVGTNSDIDQRKRIEAELVRSREVAEARREQVASLLDHSSQGFLSFGLDLVVEAECSRACEAMLGLMPAGQDAAQVLFGTDQGKAELLRQTVAAAGVESDPWQCEIMLSLLPGEFQHEQSLLKAEYKALENQRFMVVLTDVTAERRLEQKVASDHRRMALIVAAVTDSRDFFDTVETFRNFLISGLAALMDSALAPTELVRELYRQVHTFKGLMNQFGFLQAPVALHALEGGLSALRDSATALSRQALSDLIQAAPLAPTFAADLALLQDALGAEFLERGDRILISSAQAGQWQRLAGKMLRGEPVDTTQSDLHQALYDMSQLRKISLKDALSGFDRLIRQTAERLDKEVATLELDGGADVWIDPQSWQPFLRSLTHVFRNAVVHGIEDPETRLGQGKNEAGTIRCSVQLQDSKVQLCIADDGAGIDVQALRGSALAAGVVTADTVAALTDAQLTDLIFLDNVSTQRQATELAGRGVGLAVVRAEARKLQGDVVVRTQIGQGTRFIFTLAF